MSNIAVIIGASSAIAAGLIEQLDKDNSVDQIVAVSRNSLPVYSQSHNKIVFFMSDYTEESMAHICSEMLALDGVITHLIICNGILHNERVKPEKKLEDISAQFFHEVVHANTVIPMLWLAKFAPLLKSDCNCRVAILSARVGSIEDNKSGGWYAYRASKAALNMMIKTASIELQRRAQNVALIAYHPGTIDTDLSKPFQKNVVDEKLFTPEFTAKKLLALMSTLTPKDVAKHYSWDSEIIPW